MQGAVSAILGGMVAALTAWWVVRATKINERKLAIESDARAAARKLLATIDEVVNELRDCKWVGSRNAVEELNRKLFMIWLLNAGDLKGHRADGTTIEYKVVSLAQQFKVLAIEAERGAGQSHALELVGELVEIMHYLHAYIADDIETVGKYFMKWNGVDLDKMPRNASDADIENWVAESLRAEKIKRRQGEKRPPR